MRNYTKTLFIALSVLVAGCSKTQDSVPSGLYGQWQKTGDYISSGGPQYFVAAKDSKYVKFNENGSIEGNAFPGFKNLKVVDSLRLTMTSRGDTVYTFGFKIKGSQLSLSPIAPYMCIEGCSQIFERR